MSKAVTQLDLQNHINRPWKEVHQQSWTQIKSYIDSIDTVVEEDQIDDEMTHDNTWRDFTCIGRTGYVNQRYVILSVHCATEAWAEGYAWIQFHRDGETTGWRNYFHASGAIKSTVPDTAADYDSGEVTIPLTNGQFHYKSLESDGGVVTVKIVGYKNGTGAGDTGHTHQLIQVTDFPWVDCRAYASFSLAIDAIGATEAVLLISEQEAVADNKTVPVNVTLKFLQGGTLNITAAKTVTINGHVEAGLYQIFEGDGSVVFGEFVEEIHAEWFGWSCFADATTNVAAFHKAVASMSTRGQALRTGPGNHSITNIIFNPPDDCKWYNQSRMVTAAVGTGITIGNTGASPDIIFRLDITGIWAETSPGGEDWTSGRIGVNIVNIYDSDINIPYVYGFEKNIQLHGKNSKGCTYNSIKLGHIYDGKNLLYLLAETSGWVTENSFYGGHFHFTSALATKVDAVAIITDGGSLIDNNRWYGPSFEAAGSDSGNAEVAIIDASFCLFLHPRVEWSTFPTTNGSWTFTVATQHNRIFSTWWGLRLSDIADSGNHNKFDTWSGLNKLGIGINASNGVLAINNATPPAGITDGSIIIYSSNEVGGYSAPHFKTGDEKVIFLYPQTYIANAVVAHELDDSSLATLEASTEDALNALGVKINALISLLKTLGLMKTS